MAIQTDAFNQAVNSPKRNVMLDDLPPPINTPVKELTRKERTLKKHARTHQRLRQMWQDTT